jgi:L-aminopeptidase/D-esterase-like protein
VNGIVLAGGSAFGLDAASGTVRWLDQDGIGFEASVARVPIVPSAILFDLGVGDAKIRPTADCGYCAAAAATAAPVAEGSIGTGAGATVGKMRGLKRAMKGGIGSAAIVMPDGLIVAALVAVSAYGDVIDSATGTVVAGVRTDDGRACALR